MTHTKSHNNRCPCGSGKEYQHCCHATEPPDSRNWVSQNWQYTNDDVWYKLRKAEGALHGRLAGFALRHISDLTLKTAMDNFVFPEKGSVLSEQVQITIDNAFQSWFFYSWPLEQ